MNGSLVKYKANVWGISKERAREILRGYSKRNYDSVGAFKKVKIGGNGDGNGSKERKIGQSSYSL